MKNNFTFLFVSFSVLLSFSQSKPLMNSEFVIRNISVITMKTDTLLSDCDVVIKNGIISSITETSKAKYKGMRIVDGSKMYIMPSLADAHVHLPEDEIQMERALSLYLINGVTKVRSMRGEWIHAEWRSKYNTTSSMYPKLYISPPPIRRNLDFTDSQIADYFKTSKEQGFDFIKILSVKDQTVFAQLDSVAKTYNFPLAGHFPSNISNSAVINSNYTSFEHLGGLTGTSDDVNKRLNYMKEKNIVICPTLSWYSIGSGRYTYDELRTLPGMEFVASATVDEWIKKTEAYREKLGSDAYRNEVEQELKSLDEKFQIITNLNTLGIPMLLSPDSSSNYMIPGFNMVGEMLLLKNANLSNYEILKMATLNFANFFEEDYGTIAPGKPADFIILKKNPLDDLNALKEIEGLYFNSQFLDGKKLKTMRMDLLKSSQN